MNGQMKNFGDFSELEKNKYNLCFLIRECGCGEGDSGCAECGCCRICARENVDNSELAILGPSGAGDFAGMMRLDLIFGGNMCQSFH